MLAACGGGSGGDGEDAGNPGGGGEVPAGLSCSTTGSFDACAEARRLGALTLSFEQLVSLAYGLRYSQASTVAATPAAQDCPGGGRHSATVVASNTVMLSFSACAAPVGTLDGTVTVARQALDSLTVDNDRLAFDLQVDGVRYGGTVSAQHRRLSGSELFTLGLASPLGVDAGAGSPLTATSFGVSLREQADGAYLESGDLSLSLVDGAGAAMSLQSGTDSARYLRTGAGSSGLFLSFGAPADGVLRYARSVPGQTGVSGAVTAEGERFSAPLSAGGTPQTVAGTWAAATAAALYSPR